MKIISKFYDYYDSVLKMGMEESIKYIRHTVQIKDYETIKYVEGLFERLPRDKDFSPILFFFCGKIYISYKFNRYEQDSGHCYGVDYEGNVYTFKEVVKLMTKHKKKWEVLESYLWKKYTRWKWIYENVENIFQEYNGSKETDLNVKYKTPVIVCHLLNGELEIISNPLLKDFKFAKLFDPYSAFQEISMFVGGVLGNEEPPMLEVSEKDKIKQHGFNKWSFRKPPKDKK